MEEAFATVLPFRPAECWRKCSVVYGDVSLPWIASYTSARTSRCRGLRHARAHERLARPYCDMYECNDLSLLWITSCKSAGTWRLTQLVERISVCRISDHKHGHLLSQNYANMAFDRRHSKFYWTSHRSKLLAALRSCTFFKFRHL